ncbi:hypothetical protein CEXT_49421 [Caerostris extrusa]|uniref:Uncharacterized protein n=1 Tax=Caerostris extrusa TaxID=172846 RepID=A0AAV4XMC4_CAEEX|nr:hypothetical protein CEXT_49421 [Caerostris extrusa]
MNGQKNKKRINNNNFFQVKTEKGNVRKRFKRSGGDFRTCHSVKNEKANERDSQMNECSDPNYQQLFVPVTHWPTVGHSCSYHIRPLHWYYFLSRI